MVRNFTCLSYLVVALLGFSITADAAAGATPVQATAQQEDDALAQAKKAEIAGDFPRAAGFYLSYLKVHPQDPEVNQRLGLVYYLSHRYQDAIPAFQNAVKANPSLWGSALFLGICYYRLAQFTKALDPLRQALQVKPDLPDGYFWLGSALFALGRNEQAIDQARKVGPGTPVSLEATALLVRAYRQTAEIYYRRIEKVNDDSYRVHQLEAENLIWTDREAKAITAYRQALSTQPRLEDAHRMLGDLYWRRQQWEDARKEYELELRATPLSDMANLRMGQYWLAKADIARGIPYLEFALKLNKDLPEANRDLGETWLVRGDLGKAESLLKTAVRQIPDDPLAHRYLADYYRRTNRDDLAQAEQQLFDNLSKGDELENNESPKTAK